MRRRADVGLEIDLFAFDRFPEPRDEDIVAPQALAGHAGGKGIAQQSSTLAMAVTLCVKTGVDTARLST